MRAWLARRRLRKTAKQLCNEARRLRNMHEDIADPKLLAAVSEAEQQVKEAQKGGAPSAIEAALETLNTAMETLSPPRPHARIRENLEIFVVAIVVAMGFRTLQDSHRLHAADALRHLCGSSNGEEMV